MKFTSALFAALAAFALVGCVSQPIPLPKPVDVNQMKWEKTEVKTSVYDIPSTTIAGKDGKPMGTGSVHIVATEQNGPAARQEVILAQNQTIVEALRVKALQRVEEEKLDAEHPCRHGAFSLKTPSFCFGGPNGSFDGGAAYFSGAYANNGGGPSGYSYRYTTGSSPYTRDRGGPSGSNKPFSTGTSKATANGGGPSGGNTTYANGSPGHSTPNSGGPSGTNVVYRH